jgi:transcriptional regulator with XRE-family HTH domain
MNEREPTVRSRELGLALSRATAAQGLNRTEMADRLGWSHSKISRIYNGKRGATTEDIAAILASCGVTGPKRDELVDLARHANHPGWWQEYGTGLPMEIRTLSDYEDAAIININFQNVMVPGLLQTVAYMRNYMQRTPLIPAKEIKERIEARLRRQQILDRHFPAKFQFYIDEYALRRTGPGHEIMSEQLHHLLRLSVRSHIEIYVVPDSMGFHAGQMPFNLMQFTEFHPVVFVEHLTSALFLERPDTVNSHYRVINRLANIALDQHQSRALIAGLATRREEHDEHPPPLEEELPH